MTMFVLYMSDMLGFGYGKKLENALYDLIFQNGFLCEVFRNKQIFVNIGIAAIMEEGI